MAVSLIRQPEALSFSRNPMLFEFRSDSVMVQPGQLYRGWLFFSGSRLNDYTGPQEGRVMILSYYGRREVFTFTANPDNSGYQLPLKLSSETPLQWIGRVMATLNKNFNIRSRYTLSLTPSAQVGSPGAGGFVEYSIACIEFLAKENAELADIELITRIGEAQDAFFMMLPRQTGASPVYTENLRIYAELFALKGGVSQKLMAASMPTDSEGIVRWDVSLPLTSFLELNGSDLPDFGAKDFAIGKGVISYYINYTEVSGANQVTSGFMQTATKSALLGGVSKADIGKSVENVIKLDGLSRWLLPSGTYEQLILPDQPLWLSWINLNNEISGALLRVTIEYDNDTRWVVDMPVPSVHKYGKLILPVDIDSLQLNSHYPEYRITAYSVQLQAEGTPISKPMRYDLDERYLPYARVFLFQNSFGAYETLYTYGRKVTSYELEKSTARIIQVKDFSIAQGEEIDFDITIRNKEKVNTGFRTREEIASMRDFFVSREKYTYVDGRWWPINLSSSTIEEHTDGGNLHSITFEITGQHLEELWNN